MYTFNTYEEILNSCQSVRLSDHWKRILECRECFFEKDNGDLCDLEYLDRKIAESWVNSRKKGANRSRIAEESLWQLSVEDTEKVLQENECLIDVTQNMFRTLRVKDMAIASKYALYLFDRNGVLLQHEGDSLFPDNSKVGTIWTEETVGTCAHVMSKNLKRPTHLVGPEHYSDLFKNSSVLAAPIMDDEGEVSAILVLSQHFIEPDLDNSSFVRLSMQARGLILGMATAIENRLKLQRSYDQLKMASEDLKKSHAIVSVTLSVIEGGLITVDLEGNIIHINKECSQILKINNEKNNRNIYEYLNSNSQLMKMVRIGEKADLEEIIFVDGEEKTYWFNIWPVYNDQNGDKSLYGAVLRLLNLERIDNMATRRTGATVLYKYDDLIGSSREFKKAVELGKRFARSHENVLLIGESGTGKELFAQSIHNQCRPGGPFIAVNCAAMPRELIESELFGYEGGSFTGAERNGKPGKIELAQGGTLFLDEIGDMPFELQAVLLRVLEDKQVMRIGGRRYKKVDFRLIAATNKNLFQMMEEKLFREDLYYRLSVLSINLPPLRQRGKDVELLSRYFVQNYCKKVGWENFDVSPEAIKKINEYKWPGNVRQLENAIVYAVNHADHQIIKAEDLPAVVIGENAPKQEPVSGEIGEVTTIEAMEKVVIENALFKTRNNISKAAELLGIGKSTLYRKLKEYNISVEQYK